MPYFTRRLFPLVIVNQNTCRMVEIFGKFHRQLRAGYHFVPPFISHLSEEIDLREYTTTIVNQEVITKDNIKIKINGAIFCQNLDPQKVAYSITNPSEAIKIIAESMLRCEIGKTPLDVVLHNRQDINEKLKNEIMSYADRWGVTCFRYEITEVKIDDEFVKYMNYEAESERQRRTLQLDAQSFEQSNINNAQQKKNILINQKKYEGRALYYFLSAWAARARVLKEFLAGDPQNKIVLESKLRSDLIKSYEELGSGDKNMFVKRNLADPQNILKSISLDGTGSPK